MRHTEVSRSHCLCGSKFPRNFRQLLVKIDCCFVREGDGSLESTRLSPASVRLITTVAVEDRTRSGCGCDRSCSVLHSRIFA
jgi:hypothetical protein